jgi:nickel/cobalt transporter (NicO) family protein
MEDPMRIGIIIAIVAAILPSVLSAHPHIFVEVQGEFHVEEGMLREIGIVWHLDAMSSDMVLVDCDWNGNRRIDPDEMDDLRSYYLDQFSENNFCTQMLVDGEVLDADAYQVRFESVESRDERLLLHLTASIHESVSLMDRQLGLLFEHAYSLIAFTIAEQEQWQSTAADLQLAVHDDGISCQLLEPRPQVADAQQAQPTKTSQNMHVTQAASLGLARASLGQPSLRKRFMKIQEIFNREVGSVLLRAKTGEGDLVLLLLFSLAAAYGLVHAAGPGHGKSLVVGFFLNRRAGVRDSIVLAALIAITHSFAAFALAAVFQGVFQHIKGVQRIQLQGWITVGIASCLVLYGCWTLIAHLLHRPAAGEDDPDMRNLRGRSVWGVGLMAGIVPCPLSVTVMMLALTNNVPLLGIVGVCGIMLGMFVLLSGVGAITVITKRQLQRPGPVIMRLRQGVELAGGALIILAGVTLGLLYYPGYAV